MTAIYQKAVLMWGRAAQIDMIIEECAELIKVLLDERRNRANSADVIEEVADVIIMTRQARVLYDSEQIDAAIERKLARLRERVQ